MATLPKVTQYVKNVGKSIAYASAYAIGENTSGIRDFVRDNNDVFKEAYSSIRNYRSSIRTVEKNIKQSNLYQAVDSGIKNMIEDIKSGNFYNDRTYEVSESALGLDGFDDFDLDFNYDDDEDIDSDVNGKSSISDSFNQAIGAAASIQSTAVAQSTDLMIKSNKASTKLMLTQMDRISASISSSIGAVYTAVDRTNQFLNGPMITHIENSKKYYETTTDILREQQLMMKEMLEMQRNVYKAQTTEYKTSKFNQSVRFDGSMDIGGYLKNIKSNISDFADSMGLSMLSMDMGGGNPFMLYAAAPFKMVLEPLMQRLMSNDFKKALKSFDKGVTSMFTQAVARMNTARDSSDGSLMSLIGKIFGITVEKKETINTANYKKDTVPFDGITRQSIIEVIPGYLARIESALSGFGERHYDFRSGSWKSAKQIEKDYEFAKKSAIANANYDIRSDLAELRNELKLINPKYEERISKSVDNMMATIYKDGGDFRPQMGKGSRGVFDTPAWKYYGFSSEKDFDMVLKRLSRDTIRNIAYNNIEGRQNFSRMMREEEANGGVYRHLFSGAYNKNGTGSGLHNPSNFTAGSGLLSISRDKDGHNVFWYLREILNNISIRNRNARKNKYKEVKYTSNSTNINVSSSTDNNNNSNEEDTDSGEDDIPWDKIEEEYNRKNSIKSENNKFGNWLKNKLEKTSAGRYISNILGGAGAILSKPMEYATKLLNKADENMFKMMFGVNEFKDENGQPIESIFQYIMYKIKHSFEELTNWFKKNVFERFKQFIKPYWEKYGEPLKNEVGNAAKTGFGRFKKGISNTFGKVFGSFADRLRNGDVISADEVENAASNARGGIVTKRGLTMISPGEMIIPASFNKKEQDKMLALEKRDKKRILDAIQYNASGTVRIDDLKDKLNDIMNDVINDNKGRKKYKIGAGGILGAGAGLLSGINPLLGALAGAGISILNNSETLKRIVFGKEIKDEYGSESRSGGIIPKKIYDIFKESAPDMTDFGIAGGVLGLFTPFGVLGGAAIGAGLGYLKNNDNFKKFIFGDVETDEEGLIKRESYDKFISYVKKSAPNIAIGAGAGILLGPFGILGNAAIGAGLGLLSSTDEFHKFVFGDENGDNEGLVGAIKNGIINPAKEKILEFAQDFKEYTKKNILEPTKNFWEPFNQLLKNTITNTADSVKDHLNDMFEKSLGLPMRDFLQEKLFKPVTKLVFGLLKAPITVGKAVVAAPFRALGGIGNSIRMRQIQKGTAYNMSASERLAFRDQHQVRNFLGTLFGRDRMLDQDIMLSNMTEEQLEKLSSNALSGLTSVEELQRRAGNARNAVGSEISKFFNTNNRYSKVKYDIVKKITALASDGDFDKAMKFIDKQNLTDEEKNELKNRIAPLIRNANDANRNLKASKTSTRELDIEVSNLIGRKFTGRKDRRQMYRSAEAELKSRRKTRDITNESPEEHATNNLAELYKARADKIIELFVSANKKLDTLINPHKKDTTPPGDVKREHENAINIDSSNDKTNASKGIDSVTSNNNTNKKYVDQITGNVITDDPDSKENVENEKERKEKDKREQEQVDAANTTNNTLNTLIDKLFSEKDKEGVGLLRKIGSGVGTLLNFLGIGAKIGLGAIALGGGVSLFGYATEWFKTSIWPTIRDYLFGTTDSEGNKTSNGLLGGISQSFKNVMFGEDGKGGYFAKITQWFDNKITAAKEWFESEGGLSGIFLNRIVPGMITGWGYAVNNVVAPLTAIILKSLPSLLIGLGKGILEGLKIAVFNKELPNQSGVMKIDTTESINELASVNSNTNTALESSFGSFMGSIKNVFNTAKNSSVYTANAAKELDLSKIFVSSEKNNKKASGIGGLLGRTKRTNELEYDENGNIITTYTQNNTTDSLFSRVGSSAQRGFIKGLAGDVASGGFVKALGNLKVKGIGKATSFIGAASRGLTSGLKGIGNVLGGTSKLGSVINESIQNFGSSAASNVSKNALKDGLTKIFTNIADSKIGSMIITSIKNATGKEVTQDIVKKTLLKIADKLSSVTSSKLLVNASAKAAGSGISNIATVIAGFSPLAIALMVVDFVWGYDNAYTILGIAKGGEGEYQVGFGQRCACGLLNLINQRITLGLISTSTIVDIIVEYLFPLFGLSADELKEAQDQAAAVLDEWNKNNPNETYDNLEDFNNKDKWWLKAWKGAKTTASNAVDSVIDFHKKSIEAAETTFDISKEVWKVVGTAIDNRLYNAWNNPEELKDEELESTGNEMIDDIAESVYDVAKIFTTPNVLLGRGVNIIKKEFDKFANSAGKVKDSVDQSISNIVKRASEGDISPIMEGITKSTDNKTLDAIANVVFGVTKIFTAPVALLHAGGKIIKDEINKVIEGYKTSQVTKQEDDKKIEDAYNGNLSIFSSRYWSNADHSDEGIIGTFTNIQTYIEKIINAPIILVKNIMNKITSSFDDVKNWFGDKVGGLWDWIDGFFNGNGKEEITKNIPKSNGSGRSLYGLGHSYQTDPSIANIKYGDSTIGQSGCAPVAAANVLNNMGYTSDTKTVLDAANFAEKRNMTVPGGGTDIRYFNSYFGSKGISTSNTTNKDNILNALNQGNQVILLGKDNNNNPGVPYGTTPHFITAKGIDSNGNIIAEDPYFPDNTVTYNTNQTLNSMISSVIVNKPKNRKSTGLRRAIGKKISKVSKSFKGMGKILYGLGGSLGPNAIINVAKSQIGVVAPNNKVKYNYAYYGNNVSGSKYPWCCAFVWWVFNQAGAAELFYGGQKTASCATLQDYYKSHGQSVKDPKPGDIVFFNWDGGTRPQHVGIVIGVTDSTHIITIEGNTGYSNNANGGSVMQRDRGIKEIVGYARPNYPYTYDPSKVVDMSKYGGDTTDYKSIAMNGGAMTSGDYSSTSSTSSSSTGGTLLNQLTSLGTSMVKAMYGEDAYNALFGSVAPSDNGTETPGDDPSHSTVLTGNDDAQKIWNYLKSKGFTDIGASGIMGCWQHESNNKSNRLEGDYMKSFPGFENVLKNSSTLNDYTTGILFPAYAKSGLSINKNAYKGSDGNYYPGIGLAQWTGPRGYNLFSYAKNNGKDWKELGTQLDFFNSEVTSSFKNKVNSATTPQEAAHAVLDGYEMYEGFGARNPSFLNPRQNAASSIYSKFAGSGRAPVSGSGKTITAMNNAYNKNYTKNISTGSVRSIGLPNTVAETNISTNAINSSPATIPIVDYQTFLQTIVSVLMNISDNTALLVKILDILSNNFNINIDKSDIDAAASRTKEQTELALQDLVRRSSGNNVNISKLLNNKDTGYIVSAMQAIASE